MPSRPESAALETGLTDPLHEERRWLSIAGLGEDGVAGLSAAARAAIGAAEIVYGGRRHLALAASLIAGEQRVWPSPFESAVDEIAGLRGRAICVLASGDPFHFGAGATLARRIDAGEMRVFPAPSAFSLAAARLGWPLQSVETVSLHGRPIALIRPLLDPGTRILALTADGEAPGKIAALLTGDGFGGSRFHVLERLGGPQEAHTETTAAAVTGRLFDDLNVIAVEVRAAAGARILPLGTGLDEALFEHDGQITKPEVRAVTLSALEPRRGRLLWDVGAGAGSVCIEWMRQHPLLRALAIEADPDRAARIRRNAEHFGVPGLEVVEGAAPEALEGLPVPDAIFVGGGGSAPGVMAAAMKALRPGGRLVANAVTLEMQAVLLDTQARLGGELIEIAIARTAPVGGMTALRPALPVLQWRWEKS
ncbi:precorrin-6y C5,15-methyltransferase (decarboxylating) subunit CbiE [Nitratireductor sp. ZSWI3]|uniref:precorrin-6y C5,15-methyltransferase (decarboxylating) subunit CbiE n=1 Tax=Nitratireductor sp. ZSWI3 TaxID=2966359 RepID=UPI00214F6267|nr:precorrin-6y C5,15-methyltransferase (decarboxylating) subunit CbiE [Nitratireductor sp. ZSWI3]MCR4269437.1 precorrin-6y C5,15-methyltransferase (decarboxylating) subunit CbiE [Nitratireductor sp. ZSWI3]